MKKVLSLVLVLAMVLGSFSFAFAAEDVPAGLERIVENGFFGAGGLRLADKATRAEFAVIALRLAGFNDDEVRNLNEKANFSDVADGDWFAPFVGKAVKEGLFAGDAGANTFRPNDEVSYAELLVVMLRALGYGNDFAGLAWPNGYVLKAAQAGINVDMSIDPLAKITRNVVAYTMESTLDAKVKGSDLTLAQELGIEEVVEEPPVVVPDDFAVVSAGADNLKEITVVFNQKVDEDTVKEENFELEDTDGISVAIEEVKLQADGKTVKVVVKEALTNQENYTITVSDIENLYGEKIEDTEKEFYVFDNKIPVAQEVVVTGPANLEIVFSEPINDDVPGEVEVKEGSSLIGNAAPQIDGNVAKIELYTDMEDGKTYTVKVVGFEDYAGYKNIVTNFDVVYVEDKTPPVATVVRAEQTYVVVEFSKPVKGLTGDHFYHTFSAWVAENGDADDIGVFANAAMTEEVTPDQSYSKVWVRFAVRVNDEIVGYPIGEGTTTFGIKAKANDYEIQDNWGNKLGTVTMEIAVTADKVKPQVTSIEVKAEDKVLVKFNKDVEMDETNVEVLTTNGEEIDGVYVEVNQGDSAKEWEILFNKDLSGETIVIRIKDVEDKALTPNKLALYTKTITMVDKTAPSVSKVNFATLDNEKTYLYVFFNEDVEAATALTAGNYFIVDKDSEGKARYTKLSKTPVFVSGRKVVRIELTSTQKDRLEGALTSDPTTGVFVTGVKDVAGNTMSGALYHAEIAELKTDKPAVEKVQAVTNKKIEVIFDQQLNKVDRNAFAVYVGDEIHEDNKVGISMALSTNSKGNTVATLTTSKSFKTDLSNLYLVIDTKYNLDEETSLIRNIFSIYADIDETYDTNSIDDKVAPYVTKHGSDDYDKNNNSLKDKYKVDLVSLEVEAGTTEKAVLVTFSENIEPATVSTMTFSVETHDIVEVLPQNNQIMIRISPKSNAPALPRVTQTADVTDIDGNKYRLTTSVRVNNRLDQEYTIVTTP